MACLTCEELGRTCDDCDDADTPPLGDVLQEEHGPTLPMPAVAVAVDGPVRVDPLPTRLGAAVWRSIPASSTGERIVGADSRRARVILWVDPDNTASNDVMIGTGQAEVEQLRGAVLQCTGTVPVRFEFTTQSELWARAVTLTSGRYVASPALPGLLNVVTELWSR